MYSCMDINRRTVLLGFGATGFGATGVLIGTSAFSSASAERDIAVNVTDDSDGVLSFEINSPVGDEILTETTGGGPAVIKIEQDDLNRHATTLFQDALKVTNSGSQDVGFSVDKSRSNDPNDLIGSALDIRESGSSIVDSGTGNNAVDLDTNAPVDFTIAIDLRNGNQGSDISTINTVAFAARQADHSTA